MIDRVRFLYEASAPLTVRIPVLICRGELVPSDTAWLGGCLALDNKQFIKTGAELGVDWPFAVLPTFSKQAVLVCSRLVTSGG